MMRKLSFVFACLFSFSTQLKAAACEGSNAAPNEWLISLNVDDQASREDVLKSLELFGTGGFRIIGMMAYPGVATKTFHIGFSPEYYRIAGRADEVKNQVISALESVSGNIVDCNHDNIPKNYPI
ncbi:MAG: hypothetical protein AB7T49_13180 [Oligoflexales bacterium]